MIQVEDLSKRYRQDLPLILDGLSFSVPHGETLSIIGPSGCGKTTLLYILGGLLAFTGGKVSIDNTEVNKPTKQTSLIFQDFGLLPWKTAWENACLGMKIAGFAKSKQAAIAETIFKDLGISQLKNSYPIQLSGGEKQRVGIARSLAVSPELLLMDEPFSALDAMTREKLQDLILAKWKERQFTTVLVTHSIEEAVFLGRKIMILGNSPAKVEKIIDNPGFGSGGYRLKDEYFGVIKEVRNAVDNLSTACAKA